MTSDNYPHVYSILVPYIIGEVLGMDEYDYSERDKLSELLYSLSVTDLVNMAERPQLLRTKRRKPLDYAGSGIGDTISRGLKKLRLKKKTDDDLFAERVEENRKRGSPNNGVVNVIDLTNLSRNRFDYLTEEIMRIGGADPRKSTTRVRDELIKMGIERAQEIAFDSRKIDAFFEKLSPYSGSGLRDIWNKITLTRKSDNEIFEERVEENRLQGFPNNGVVKVIDLPGLTRSRGRIFYLTDAIIRVGEGTPDMSPVISDYLVRIGYEEAQKIAMNKEMSRNLIKSLHIRR